MRQFICYITFIFILMTPIYAQDLQPIPSPTLLPLPMPTTSASTMYERPTVTNPEAYELAQERIAEAKATNSDFLDLQYLSLGELPPEIGELTNLRVLLLCFNTLSKLPPEIGQLTNLENLSLCGNKLTELPPEIGQLTNLRELSVYGNLLSDLPSEIEALSNLERLDLSWNNLIHLPAELGMLKNLQSLGWWGNPLISPPETVQLEGTDAVLAYLRNQAAWHIRKMVGGAATFVGVLAIIGLGIRWRNRRFNKRKRKVKAA